MTGSPSPVGDMPAGGWIDRYIPAKGRPYMQLMRLDRPIGMWLLLWPCWWSLVLASGTHGTALTTTAGLMALFGVGALVMRGAGCTYNDIIDRDFDSRVARTATRPIPSGAISLHRATTFLIVQLLAGLLILVQFNIFAISLGAASLVLVFSYPFMKRITFWPQLWLGFTFNWGGLLGWAAVTGSLDMPAIALYTAGLFWTLGYDTIYAHQDKEDDVRIGIKSSALVLGERTRPMVALFYACALALTAAAGLLAGCESTFLLGLGAAGLHLFWQVATLDIYNREDCSSKFRSNLWYGWLVLGGIVNGITASA